MKLNKLLILVLLIGSCLIQVGCGEKEKISAPILETALRNELDNYYDYIGDFSYEVVDENVKKNKHEVAVSIDAVGKYAVFKIQGTLYFTKDGDSWVFLDGNLSKKSHEVKNYPDMTSFNQVALKQISESRLIEDGYSLISAERSNDVIGLRFTKIKDCYLYRYTDDYYIYFVYEPIREEWLLDKSLKERYAYNPLLINLDGEYIMSYNRLLFIDEVPVKIYDCTNEEFTIDYPSEDQPLTFKFSGQGDYRCDIDEKTYKETKVKKINDHEYELQFYEFKEQMGMGAYEGSCEGKVIITI